MGLFGPSKKEKELQAEIDRLNGMLTPEQSEIIELRKQIEELKEQKRESEKDLFSVHNQIGKCQTEIDQYQKEITSLKAQIINFQDELEMGIRVIGFALKRKLFNINDLELLIKLINNFYECVLDSIPINEETEKIWLGLFSSLSDIFLMIGIDYNDQVVEEYFEKGKFYQMIKKENI